MPASVLSAALNKSLGKDGMQLFPQAVEVFTQTSSSLSFGLLAGTHMTKVICYT